MRTPASANHCGGVKPRSQGGFTRRNSIANRSTPDSTRNQAKTYQPACGRSAMLVVFVVLYRMALRPQAGWYVFAWFLVLSGVERFAIEFLRVNPPWLLGFTPPQWFALAGVLIGTAVLLATRQRQPDVLKATA